MRIKVWRALNRGCLSGCARMAILFFPLPRSLSKRIEKVIWIRRAAAVLSLNENLGCVQIPTLICGFGNVTSSSPLPQSLMPQHVSLSPRCVSAVLIVLSQWNRSQKEISPSLPSISLSSALPPPSISSTPSAGVLNSPFYFASRPAPLHEPLMSGGERIMEMEKEVGIKRNRLTVGWKPGNK